MTAAAVWLISWAFVILAADPVARLVRQWRGRAS